MLLLCFQVQQGTIFPWRSTGNCLFVSFAAQEAHTGQLVQKVFPAKLTKLHNHDVDVDAERVCDSCGAAARSDADPTDSVALCTRCTSQLVTPFFSVEFQMTAEAACRVEVRPQSTRCDSTASLLASRNSITAVPAESILRVEQRCWAGDATKVSDSNPELCLKFLHTNNYEKMFPHKRKKCVRFGGLGEVSEENGARDGGEEDTTSGDESAGAACGKPSRERITCELNFIVSFLVASRHQVQTFPRQVREGGNAAVPWSCLLLGVCSPAEGRGVPGGPAGGPHARADGGGGVVVSTRTEESCGVE